MVAHIIHAYIDHCSREFRSLLRALAQKRYSNICYSRMASITTRHCLPPVSRHLQKRPTSRSHTLTSPKYLHQTVRSRYQHRIYLPSCFAHLCRNLPLESHPRQDAHHDRHLGYLCLFRQRAGHCDVGEREDGTTGDEGEVE